MGIADRAAFAYPIAGSGESRPMPDGLEEAHLLIGIRAELVTEDAKRTRRVAEAAGDLQGRTAIDEVGTS